MVCLSQFGGLHILICRALDAFQRLSTGRLRLRTPPAPPRLKVMLGRWVKGLEKDSAVGFWCGWCCQLCTLRLCCEEWLGFQTEVLQLEA